MLPPGARASTAASSGLGPARLLHSDASDLEALLHSNASDLDGLTVRPGADDPPRVRFDIDTVLVTERLLSPRPPLLAAGDTFFSL